MTVNLNLPSSWRTTLSGLITAVAGFVVVEPSLFQTQHPYIFALSKYVMVGGFAAIGLFAKDSVVTGGSVANTTNDPKIVAETAVKV